jgi:hypothetical protein
MKKYILLILLILIIGGGTYYFYINKSGFKIYKNKDLGYELKYPRNFYIVDKTPDIVVISDVKMLRGSFGAGNETFVLYIESFSDEMAKMAKKKNGNIQTRFELHTNPDYLISSLKENPPFPQHKIEKLPISDNKEIVSAIYQISPSHILAKSYIYKVYSDKRTLGHIILSAEIIPQNLDILKEIENNLKIFLKY